MEVLETKPCTRCYKEFPLELLFEMTPLQDPLTGFWHYGRFCPECQKERETNARYRDANKIVPLL